MNKLKLITLIMLLSITYSCKAQSQLQISNYNTEIIGTWVSNEDSSYKRVFTSNGICNDYSEEELVSTYTYNISTSCEEENTHGFIYLNLIDEDNDKYCFEINAINENNSNVLSLTGLMRGKIQLYTKQ